MRGVLEHIRHVPQPDRAELNRDMRWMALAVIAQVAGIPSKIGLATGRHRAVRVGADMGAVVPIGRKRHELRV